MNLKQEVKSEKLAEVIDLETMLEKKPQKPEPALMVEQKKPHLDF